MLLKQHQSGSFNLSSFSNSLLLPLTYLGGLFLKKKRSQRKHFHLCSHLMISNRSRWRDTWVDVRHDRGCTHMGRWNRGTARTWGFGIEVKHLAMTRRRPNCCKLWDESTWPHQRGCFPLFQLQVIKHLLQIHSEGTKNVDCKPSQQSSMEYKDAKGQKTPPNKSVIVCLC